MRSPVNENFSRLSRGLALIALAAGLSACGTVQGLTDDSLTSASAFSAQQRSNGPAADYPVIVGEPYVVNGIEYVPDDSLNYDNVGYATLDQGARAYSASHHTLPVPSYIEVTSLDTGRTILVRVERRGPMDTNDLVALSPAALAQLGATSQAAVRVRRVNPPEEERFMLRAGDAAPLRMDTPASLLTVLQRRLPPAGVVPLQVAQAAPPVSSAIETVTLDASTAVEQPVPQELQAMAQVEAVETVPTIDAPDEPLQDTATLPTGTEVLAEAPVPATAPVATGNLIVQAAAFSTRERAERAAEALGGFVTEAGRYFRVRTGPFATRGEAEASLANVRRAGYTDARIQTSG